MSISIIEFAKRAGVSKSTVSRAFSSSSSVKPETKERILRLANELGYRPDPSARALKKSTCESIGLLMAAPWTTSDLVDELRCYSPFIKSIAEQLSKHEKNLMFASMGELLHPQNDCGVNLPKMLNETHVQQVIVLGHMWPGLAQELSKLQIKAVVVDGPACGLPAVQRNEIAVAQKLVDHLAKLGHRQIALINHPPCPRTHYRDTLWPQGYYKGMMKHNLVPLPGWDHFEHQEAMLKSLLALPARPTAILTYDDREAISIIQSLHRVGIAVPQDMSIAALSDIGYGQTHTPPIARMTYPFEKIAQEAVDLLLKKTKQPVAKPSLIKLPGKIILDGTISEPSK